MIIRLQFSAILQQKHLVIFSSGFQVRGNIKSMKQTSLFDSFIKKSQTNSQASQSKSQPSEKWSQSSDNKKQQQLENTFERVNLNAQNQHSNDNSFPIKKQINKQTNITSKSFLSSVEEFDINNKNENNEKGNQALKKTQSKIQKQQKLEQMEIQKLKPQKIEIQQPNSQSQQQYNFKRLKKPQTTNNKKTNEKQQKTQVKSNAKNAKNKLTLRKKNQSDDFNEQEQSNSQSFSASQESSIQQSFEEDGQDQEFAKNRKPAARTNRNKATNKKPALKKTQKKTQQKLFAQSNNKMQVQNEQQQNGQQNQSSQVCQDTIAFDRSKFSDATPNWAIPGHKECKDKSGNSPLNQDGSPNPNYDETTLLVPKRVCLQSSGAMTQYWRIKEDNFDKVIFFKLGKFYELFYEDALIGNQLLNLKWMGTKMHVGFPQKTLQRYTGQLVKHGLKVVVVEQMQTPDEMNKRLAQQKKKGIKSQKTLKRQITQIITKGTHQHQQNLQDQSPIYLPNYLISVYRYQNSIAYTLFQIVTNSLLLGIVNNFQQFKTILYQTRPSQLLYDPDNLPKQLVDIMKENIQGMVLSKLINKQNLWHYLNAVNQLQQLVDKKQIERPKILDQLEKLDSSAKKNLILSTLSGLFQYLHKIFKFQYVLATAKFKFYQKEKALTHMVLDSQALQHLEIFETAFGQNGSLFQKIDRTKTKFGKRLFRRWMTSPLLSQYQINQRLDAVADLRELNNELNKIEVLFSKLPDLEKLANRLYKYSVTNTTAATAVYFQDVHASRLKEFDTFMKNMQDSLIILKFIQDHYNQFKSNRLKRLITVSEAQSSTQEKLIYFEDQQFNYQEDQSMKQQKIQGLLPDIISHLHSFKQYVIWKDGKIFPKHGVIQTYDKLLIKENHFKQKLNEILEQIRIKYKSPIIQYVHIKQRYQVQIPENKNIKLPKEYVFSSRKAGYSRYLVPQVRQIVQELQVTQKGIKTQMGIFITFFFQQFKQKQNIWERYINILAQVDCFCGMAQYSRQRKCCRPEFIQEGYQVKDGVHPALYTIDFVPNDISFQHPIIILTGPNMGGKSTILRTSCLLTIMAQMGCFVPCKSYKASIVDRIFTRIGASDKLQAGKSTFFIQMEQTKSIVNHATKRSLAIIDELGRGTATYDGMALAHSVLNYLINKIGCKCMFATHYHSLTQEFASMPGTCLKMMDYQIVKGQEDRIEFLYKLVNGKAQKSFGLNVAQLVGLPKELISCARVKSDQMHQQIEKKKKKVRIYEILEEIM